MKIRLLQADDWTGLYINDILKLEGHSLSLASVIEFISPDADFKQIWNDNEQFWSNYGYRCPEKWSNEMEQFDED